MDTDEFDPVTLSILWSRLIAIADELATALMRTSFSTIVRESNDYSTMLLDANGNSLAENTAGIPSFLGTLPRTLGHMLKRYPLAEWRPGDCVITNDPWMATGHLPDITMVAPVYNRGELVGFSGSISHLPDIGGSLWAADCRDVWEEGLRIPPIKFLREGQPNTDVVDLILSNVRTPAQVLGDLYAHVAAHEVCARGLAKFLADSGRVNLMALSQALQDRADAAMRRAIEAVPEGVYRHTVVADGFDDVETRIVCTLTARDSTIHVDYAGTSPQIARGLNSVMNYTYAYTVYPIKCALEPYTPRNEGSYRAITVTAPLGSILNPRFGAACGARALSGQLLAGAVYGCLSQAVPDKVIAECGSAPSLRVVLGGTDRQGNRFSQVLFANGGMGASAAADGLSTMAFPTNSGSGSIEAFEAVAPLIVWKKELRKDSGGAGRLRGGVGQDIMVEVVSSEPIQLSLISDRQKYPAQGLAGGKPGCPAEIRLGDGRIPHPKSRSLLEPGDQLILRFPGGGGYGDPAERDLARVMEDVREGYISAESALDDYKVPISCQLPVSG